MSCSIPNEAIKNVAKSLGKNETEVNAYVDVINDIIGGDYDIAERMNNSMLKDTVELTEMFFKDKSPEETKSFKESFKNAISNNKNINPVVLYSKMLMEKAQEEVRSASSKSRFIDKHNHEGISSPFEEKEDIQLFKDAFMGGKSRANIFSFAKIIALHDERMAEKLLKIADIAEKMNGGKPLYLNLVDERYDLQMSQKGPNGEVTTGYYSQDRNEIFINASCNHYYGVDKDGYRYSDLVETIFHELTHSVTKNIILSDKEIAREGAELLEEIKRVAKANGINVERVYGFTDAHEMLSEAATGEFSKILAGLEIDKNYDTDEHAEEVLKEEEENAKKGRLQKFIDWVTEKLSNLFTKAFRRARMAEKDPKKKSALSEVEDYFNKISGIALAKTNKSLSEVNNSNNSISNQYRDQQTKDYKYTIEGILSDYKAIIDKANAIKNNGGNQELDRAKDFVNKYANFSEEDIDNIVSSIESTSKNGIVSYEGTLVEYLSFLNKPLANAFMHYYKSGEKTLSEAAKSFIELGNDRVRELINNQKKEDEESKGEDSSDDSGMKPSDEIKNLKTYKQMEEKMDSDGQPQTIEEFVLRQLATGKLQLNWSSDSVRKSVGIKEDVGSLGKQDFYKMLGQIIRTKEKGGTGTDQAVDWLKSLILNDLGIDNIDDQELKDILLDALSIGSSRGMMEAAVEIHYKNQDEEYRMIHAAQNVNSLDGELTEYTKDKFKKFDYNKDTGTGYVHVNDGDNEYLVYAVDGKTPLVQKNGTPYMIFRIDKDGKVYRVKNEANDENVSRIRSAAQKQLAFLNLNSKQKNVDKNEDEIHNAQESLTTAKRFDDGVTKLVYVDMKNGNAKTFYTHSIVVTDEHSQEVLGEAIRSNKSGSVEGIKFPLAPFAKLRENDTVMMEFEGKLLNMKITYTNSIENGISVNATFDVQSNIGYNVESAKIFSEMVDSNNFGNNKNIKKEDSFSKLDNAKELIGAKYYGNRRNMIASDFVSFVKGEGAKIVKEMIIAQANEVDSDGNNVLNPYQRANMENKANNLNDEDVINNLGIEKIFSYLKEKYNNEAIAPSNPKFNKNTKKSMKERDDAKNKYSTLISDSVWDEIIKDSLDEIAVRLQMKLTNGKVKAKNVDDKESESSEDGDNPTDAMSMEESYIEHYQLSPAKQAKHESLTIELKEYLGSLQEYDGLVAKTDDLGYPVMMDEEVVFKYLQSKLYDCKTMNEMEERLSNIVDSRPQYRALYEEIRKDETTGRAKNDNIRSALFRGMTAQMKNLYATKYGTKKVNGTNEKVNSIVSFQFNRNDAATSIVNDALNNIMSGQVLLKNGSVYNSDGEISLNNLRTLKSNIEDFISKAKSSMVNQYGVNYFNNPKVFAKVLKERVKKNRDLVINALYIEKSKSILEKHKKAGNEDKVSEWARYINSIEKDPVLCMLGEYKDLLQKTLMAIGFDIDENGIIDLFLQNPQKLAGSKGDKSGGILYKILDVLDETDGKMLVSKKKSGILATSNTSGKELKNSMVNIAKTIDYISKGTIDSGMYENGKAVIANANPSYESKMFDMFHSKTKEDYDKYAEKEFMQYNWFKTNGNQKELLDYTSNLLEQLSGFKDSVGEVSWNEIYKEIEHDFNYLEYIDDLYQNVGEAGIQDDSFGDFNEIYKCINGVLSKLKSLGPAGNNLEDLLYKRTGLKAPERYIPTTINNALLRDFAKDDSMREKFQLFTVNHSRGKEYDDWSKADYASELMIQYFRELYDGEGNEIQGSEYVSIANPVLSDSPAAEFIRMKRRGFRGSTNNRIYDIDLMEEHFTAEDKNNFARIVFDKNFDELNDNEVRRLTTYIEMTNIVKQEVNRIAVVLTRHKNRMKAMNKWKSEERPKMEAETKRYNEEYQYYLKQVKEANGDPEKLAQIVKPTPIDTSKFKSSHKEMLDDDGTPLYTEPVAFYDIATKSDGTIKNRGGAEFKFFPGLNSVIDGKSFLDEVIDIINGNGDFNSIRNVALSRIVEIQNEGFKEAFDNWNRIGLFDKKYNFETKSDEFVHLSNSIPIFTMADDLTEELEKEKEDIVKKYPPLKEMTAEQEAARKAELDEAQKRYEENVEKFGNNMSRKTMDILHEYYDQSCLGTALIEELTITDLAYYKNPNDFQKRYKEIYAPSQKLCVDSEFGREKEKTVYLKDIELSSPDEMVDGVEKILRSIGTLDENQINGILDTYRGNNVADAQAYRSPKAYRAVKSMAGELSLKEKVVLSRMIGDIDEVVSKMSPEEIQRCKDEGISLENYDESNQKKLAEQIKNDSMCVFQTIKPFVYTQNSIESGVNGYGPIKMGTQHKNSEFALLWCTKIGKMYAEKLGKKEPNIQRLVELGEFMEENDIDVVQFNSAVKVGCQGEIDTSKYDVAKHGSFKDFLKQAISLSDGSQNPGVVHSINYADYGIQASTPEHLVDVDQLVGSQIRRLIMADIDEKAVFEIDGKKLSKKDMFDHYNSILTENILEKMKEVDELFSSPEKVEELLMSEMQGNAQYTPDMIRACKLVTLPNGKKIFPLLGDPVVSQKVEALLNSIVRGRITKQKIKGGACIQVACFGCEDLHVTWKKNKDGEKYPCEMECYLGAYSKEMIEPLLDENGILDIESLESKVDAKTFYAITHAIGYRVPTEDKYSMARLKIKGFLPPSNGSAIMLPKEITTLSGSDFDVDKMYLMLHEFNRVVRTENSGIESVKAYGEALNNIAENKDKVDTISKAVSKKLGIDKDDVANTIKEYAEAYNEYVKYYWDSVANSLNSGAKDKKNKKIIPMGFGPYIVKSRKYKNYLANFKGKEEDKLDFDSFSKTKEGEFTKEEYPDIEYKIQHINTWMYDNQTKNVVAKEYIDTITKGGVKLYNSVAVVKYKGKSEDEIGKDAESLLKERKAFSMEDAMKMARGNVAANNSRAARNNEMIDVMMSVMSNQDTASKFLNPGSFDVQKKTARMIEIVNGAKIENIIKAVVEIKDLGNDVITSENLYSKLKLLSLNELDDIRKKLVRNPNPLSPWTQIYFHDQNEIGGKLIGVYANHNCGHATSQYYNVKVTIANSFAFCGKVKTSLSDNNPSISKNCAGFLAASVDNVKDPVLSWLNQNGYTADVSMLLARLGYSADIIGLLMNQPIVKKVTEKFFNGETGDKRRLFARTCKEYFKSKDDKTSITEIIKEYEKEFRDNNPITLNKDGEVVLDPQVDSKREEDSLKEDELISQLLEGGENAETQKKVAVLFMHLLKVGQELSDFTQLTKADTQNGAAKSSVAANIAKKMKLDDLIDKNKENKNTIIFDNVFASNISSQLYDTENNELDKNTYDAIRRNVYSSSYPMLAAFDLAGVKRLSTYFGRYIPTYSEKVLDMLNSFKKEKGSSLTEEEITDILSDFNIYWMSGLECFGDEHNSEGTTILSSQDKRKLFLNNFIDKFISLKSTNKNIRDNEFIKSLRFKYVDAKTNQVIQDADIAKAKEKGTNVVRLLVLPNVGRLGKDKKKALSEAWESLYYSNNEESRKLAMNLIRYSYFRNGMGFSPDSFGHLAPMFRTELPGYKERFISVNNIKDYEIERFKSQYIRNHPDSTIIRNIDPSEVKDVIKPTFDYIVNEVYHRTKEEIKTKGSSPIAGEVAVSKSKFIKEKLTKNEKGETVSSVSRVFDVPDMLIVGNTEGLDGKKYNKEENDYAFKEGKLYKNFVRIGGKLYKKYNVNGNIIYSSIPNLGMANLTEGSSFLEYSISNDDYNSIFDFNNKYGTEAQRSRRGSSKEYMNSYMLKAIYDTFEHFASRDGKTLDGDIVYGNEETEKSERFNNLDKIGDLYDIPFMKFFIPNEKEVNENLNQKNKKNLVKVRNEEFESVGVRNFVSFYKQILNKVTDEINGVCKL